MACINFRVLVWICATHAPAVFKMMLDITIQGLKSVLEGFAVTKHEGSRQSRGISLRDCTLRSH